MRTCRNELLSPALYILYCYTIYYTLLHHATPLLFHTGVTPRNLLASPAKHCSLKGMPWHAGSCSTLLNQRTPRLLCHLLMTKTSMEEANYFVHCCWLDDSVFPFFPLSILLDLLACHPSCLSLQIDFEPEKVFWFGLDLDFEGWSHMKKYTNYTIYYISQYISYIIYIYYIY